ncbi:MAG: glycosyltransferase family A protein [Spirulinaceae cyanobacterium]
MSQLNKFFVSVIIPVYNGEAFLAEAIANIQQQGHQPLEIIIVDDGSTDQTAKIAAQYQEVVHYIYQANSGPSAARNRGIEIAQGNVITFLDVDDLWPENKLKSQLECLAKNSHVEIVQGKIQHLQIDAESQQSSIYRTLYDIGVSFNLGGAIFRKSVFDRIGLFDESLRYSEDVDWFMRAWEDKVSMIVLEEVMLLYRKHNSNMTNGRNIHTLDFIKVLKKSLDRRRKNGNTTAPQLSELFKIYQSQSNL